MTAPPPHLWGRYQHDPAMRLASVIGKVWFPLWGKLTHLDLPDQVSRVTAVKIVRRDVVASDDNVVALTLGALDGGELTPWYAGAHLDLLLPSGRMREYSLCGDPADRDHYRIAVRRIPGGGGGSIEVHDALNEGDILRIKGPRNAFPLALPGYGSPARTLRFIAGGIGITPILPMLAAAERLGLDWSMVYTGRSADSLPFLDELARYGDKITIRTDDEHGLPTPADLLGPIASGTAVYCCGPVPMLGGIRIALVGRADVELHFERFSPPPVEDGKPFTVTLASSGTQVPVSATESALAAIRRDLPSVPYSCQQGFCGTCKVRVLEGTVEHRDNILTEPERDAGVMLTCVSRAEGDHLRLDL